jgi:DNA-binding transcriptional regulator YiaG
MGVAPNTVRSWEQGINTPENIACRLMDEFRHAPDYWKKRLRQSVVRKQSAVK